MPEICRFVYGSEPDQQIRVERVKVLKDYMMLVLFNNGETRLFDALMLQGEVFEPLKDESVFANCTIEHGVPTWKDGEIDCAPEFIYNNSFEYDGTIAATTDD